MSAATEKTGRIYLVSYEDLAARTGRESLAIDLIGADRRAVPAGVVEYVRSRRGWAGPLAVAIDGEPLAETDPAYHLPILGDSETVVVMRRPQDITTVVLVGISLAASLASSFLATRVRAPRPTTSADAPARRYGFGRFSNDAYVGDAVGVLMGTRRIGGKVVAKVPGENAQGDGTLKILICLSEGAIDAIGNQTADFNRVASTAITGIDLNDQDFANFPGCVASGRLGTMGQAVMPGFDDTEIFRDVGSGGFELRNTDGVERTGGSPSGEAVSFTTLGSVDSVIARVLFPQGLYALSESGQVDAWSAKYRYRWRPVAGAWSAWTVVEVSRAEQSEFFSSPRVTPTGAPLVIEVQLERVSVEPTSAVYVDRMRWDSVLEVTNSTNTYAGFAMLGLELTAGEQLSGVPRVGALCRGLKTLEIWDGVSSTSNPTFTTGYSDNPAWQAMAVIKNTAWGMGMLAQGFLIDYPSLISWAQHCDETVSRHAGGTRPRFRSHVNMADQRDGIDWLREICRAGRCRPVLVGNTWRFVVDRPQANPVETFGDADIERDKDGLQRFIFRRELGTGGVTRPNRFVAQFENEFQKFNADTLAFPEYGEYWLATETPQEESLRFDCVTDPDQVIDEIVFYTKKARFLTRAARFNPVRPIVACQPGDRVDAATQTMGWGLASGRVLAGSTTTAAKIDRGVVLAAATTYALRVTHADNTVETRNLTMPAGTYAAGTALSFSPAMAQAPAEFESYVLGQAGVEAKPFLVTAVRPTETGGLRWEIEGLEYDAQIYDPAVVDVTLPQYSSLNNGLTAPGPLAALIAHERLTTLGYQAELSWRQAAVDAENTASFRIYRRLVGASTWVLVPEPRVSRRGAVVEIFQNDVGYEFVVVAVSIGGSYLSPYDSRHPIASVVLGLAVDAPPVPSSFSVVQVAGNLYRAQWGNVGAPDNVEYQLLTGGVYTFPGAPPVERSGGHMCLPLGPNAGRYAASPVEFELAPGLAWDFWIRAVGPNGRLSSVNENTAHEGVASAGLPVGESVKHSKSFNLSSEGTLTNLTWDGTNLWLRQTSTSTAGVWLSPEIDTGSISLTRLTFRPGTASAETDPLVSTTTWAVPSVEGDQWGLTDDSGVVMGLIGNPQPDSVQDWKFEVRTWDGTLWSDWAVWQVGASVRRTLRKYQVRVTLSRTKEPYRPALRALDVKATH